MNQIWAVEEQLQLRLSCLRVENSPWVADFTYMVYSRSCYCGSLWPLLWVIRPVAEAETSEGGGSLWWGDYRMARGWQWHAFSMSGVLEYRACPQMADELENILQSLKVVPMWRTPKQTMLAVTCFYWDMQLRLSWLPKKNYIRKSLQWEGANTVFCISLRDSRKGRAENEVWQKIPPDPVSVKERESPCRCWS